MANINEGIQTQNSREAIPWAVKVWPTPASVVSVVVIDQSTGLDVAPAVAAGSPSIIGNTIHLPLIDGLSAGHNYEVRVMYSPGIGEIEVSFMINCIE